MQYDAFVRLKLNWLNIAAQLQAFDVGILKILEKSCGVWSHDRREKSLSATSNNHLALAVLALIAEFGTGGLYFENIVLYFLP